MSKIYADNFVKNYQIHQHKTRNDIKHNFTSHIREQMLF